MRDFCLPLGAALAGLCPALFPGMAVVGSRDGRAAAGAHTPPIAAGERPVARAGWCPSRPIAAGGSAWVAKRAPIAAVES